MKLVANGCNALCNIRSKNICFLNNSLD